MSNGCRGCPFAFRASLAISIKPLNPSDVHAFLVARNEPITSAPASIAASTCLDLSIRPFAQGGARLFVLLLKDNRFGCIVGRPRSGTRSPNISSNRNIFVKDTQSSATQLTRMQSGLRNRVIKGAKTKNRNFTPLNKLVRNPLNIYVN